jgi:hypothetical protein
MGIYHSISPDTVGIENYLKNYKIFSKISFDLEYDYSAIMKDGSERKQHPCADYGTELHKAYVDGKICDGSPYIFGFHRIDDIYVWFCPVTIGYWEATNLSIYEYDVPDEHVIKGTRQVIFDPKYAISKCKISHKKLRLRSKKL